METENSSGSLESDDIQPSPQSGGWRWPDDWKLLLNLGRKRSLIHSILALLSLTAGWFLILWPQSELRPLSEVDWPDVVGEISVALLAIAGLIILTAVQVPPAVIHRLKYGFAAFFIGITGDLLDEFIIADGWLPSTIENLGKFGGMILINIAIVKWLRDNALIRKALMARQVQLHEKSIKDSLTGLHNRQHFDEVIHQYFNNPENKLSLLVIDIDDFKIFNDTYGHIKGDNVLSHLGSLLLRMIRSSDQAFRYGGEEFTVILEETDLDGALQIAERIRTAVSEYRFEPQKGLSISKTVSIGVAERRSDESAEEFIERADQAMYEAKNQGKNCTSIHSGFAGFRSFFGTNLIN